MGMINIFQHLPACWKDHINLFISMSQREVKLGGQGVQKDPVSKKPEFESPLLCMI